MGLLIGGIYGLVGLGVNLIFGVVRIVNFAHGELVMISMYATWWLQAQFGIGPYAAILIVVPRCSCVGAVIQRVIMQPLQSEPMMQMFATFGLLMVLQNGVLASTRGGVAERRSPFGSRGDWRWRAFGSAWRGWWSSSRRRCSRSALYLFLQHTMQGKAIRAVTQDRRAARA